MHSDSFEQLLNQAASWYGIDGEFWDIFGNLHTTSVAAKQSILRALGVTADTASDLEQALARLTRSEWQHMLPPAVVASETPAIEVPLHMPAERLGVRAHFTVRSEAGAVDEFDLNLFDLPQIASAEMDGQTWVRIQVTLPVALPLGYHEVRVSAGGRDGCTRYIVTPERAYTNPHLGRGGRAAGIAVSLYGVRSGRNWGCGDFHDLRSVIDWVAEELGASFVALNPLHAIHNRRPFNTSPYLPNCIFYQNYIYLDVEGMEDYAICRRARELRATPEVCAEIAALRESPFVEYERVAALKLRFLKLAFCRFLREWRTGSPRARAFEAFRTREGALLETFATYCALDEEIHLANPAIWLWTDWPAPFQDPCSDETAAFRKKRWRRVMFYQYLQWQLDMQLAAAQAWARGRHLSIGLYHDLALATDRFGSDLWAHRPFYVAGCRVGSPPDDFSPKGQDWAFPPPNSQRHFEDGYRLFAESIRKNCRHGGALRIDHVMRLFRLFWIPDGVEATEGAYVRERNLDFVRILALESVRNHVVIVGEDLGTVEPSIRETLARFGMLSYRLFYFEKNDLGEFRSPAEYPVQSLVSSTTHDLPTLAGFWIGADIEARRAANIIDDDAQRAQLAQRAIDKQKMLDVLIRLELVRRDLPRIAADYPKLTGELHNAIIGFLAMTPSQLLAINQEDLTKEVDQQNLPGSTWQYPNWGRKMRFTIEQLRGDEGTRGFTTMFHDWIERSGRRNQRD
ncbi:MAG: 4-alpha-glucanotransferase [Candidatus Solibacter sp.]